MAKGEILSGVLGTIGEEIQRLKSERMALETQVNALASTKAEIEAWLSENFTKFVEMQAAMVAMKRQAAIIFDQEE